jgi:hypothetical protein
MKILSLWSSSDNSDLRVSLRLRGGGKANGLRSVSLGLGPQLGADVSKTSALEINGASATGQGIGLAP